MPLSAKGETIKAALQKEYGKEKGERVLYAGKNAGTFTGIDTAAAQHGYLDACRRGDAAQMRTCCDQMMRGRMVR
jgi:hypothetical protein